MKMKFLGLSMALLLSQLAFAGDYTLKITENGFEPGTLKVPSGEKVTLKVLRTTDNTCAKEIVIPSKKIKAKLPLNKEVKLALGKLPKGELSFQCGMKMMSGSIVAE